MLSKDKNVLSEIHLLLNPDRELENDFGKVPVIDLKSAKSLKYILVRTKLVPLEKKKDCSRS